MSQSIGLSELIEQVKQELLSKEAVEGDAPIFYVESVELELKVTAKRDAGGGVKIDVLGVGADAKGGLSREDSHTIKVKLSSLYSKAELLEWQKTHRPEDAKRSAYQSMYGMLKAPEGNLDEQY